MFFMFAGITAKTDTKPAVSNDVMTTRLDWKLSNATDDSVKRSPGRLQKNKTLTEHINSATQIPPKKTLLVCKDQTDTENTRVIHPPNMDKRTLKLNNDSTGSLDADAALWSQDEQKIFEWTLNLYPKGTSERWEKIAEHLPEKTKVLLILTKLSRPFILLCSEATSYAKKPKEGHDLKPPPNKPLLNY